MHSILLVDDEPEILAAWRLILEQEGYEVRCATNGVDALAQLASVVPDLVVTDWMMPLMDGGELCRRLRAMPELAHVPVIVHTAVPPSQNEAANWNFCVPKPAAVEFFLTTVAALCRPRGADEQ